MSNKDSDAIKAIDQLVEIDEFPGYGISKLGYVYSYKRNMILSTYNRHGYKIVGMYIDGKHKKVKVHRLVCMAYLKNPENKLEVNHIDSNPQNNTLENLEWCTRKENIQHMVNSGRHVGTTGFRKENCINGHSFNQENTYILRNGKRSCKACWSVRSKKYYNNKKQLQSQLNHKDREE